MSNQVPLDLSNLAFPGGVVDASAFQPLKGPTSRSVPWTDPLVDVVFPALATASRLAVLVDRYQALTEDELPAAKDDYDLPRAVRLNDEANSIYDELRETRLGSGWLRDGIALLCGRTS